MTTEPDFDPRPLAQLVADLDVDTTKEIIASYLGEAPLLLTEARNAVREQRLADFHRAVHTLKSISANMGAMRLADTSRRLEDGARSGRLPAMDAVGALEQQFEAVRGRLRDWSG